MEEGTAVAVTSVVKMMVVIVGTIVGGGVVGDTSLVTLVARALTLPVAKMLLFLVGWVPNRDLLELSVEPVGNKDALVVAMWGIRKGLPLSG